MAVKYESTATKMFKRGDMMPGEKGYGNIVTSRLNKGGDMKYRGKRGKKKGMNSSNDTKKAYGY